MTAVEEIQNEIIEEFELLADDRESTIFYIMELGQKLPPMDNSLKTEANIIKGCQSKVWLTTEYKDGKVHFTADSNTDITKGLISLLIRVLSGQTPDTILNTELNFVEKIGMGQVIGSQRSNGFNSMIKQMKLYALGYRAKAQMNG
ncbi:MAG: SufE family protein [Cyclobacteriaceae bacterium]|nr:SufE family protein [Cyclobacteriaceae bacterium]